MADDAIEEQVLEVIRERLRLEIKEDSVWGMDGTEGYVTIQLVLEDPDPFESRDMDEVISSVTIDKDMLGFIDGRD